MNTHKEYQNIHSWLKKIRDILLKNNPLRVIKTLSLNSQHSLLNQCLSMQPCWSSPSPLPRADETLHKE